MKQLKQFGAFEAGVYRRHPGTPGKRNVDAYQAIWEHVNKRPLEYPKPRYGGPIMMDPADFPWVPTEYPGVFEKLMGVFTERRAQARFFRLEPGATLRQSGRGILVACSGEGRVEGARLRAFTTAFLEHGDEATFIADQDTEIIHFGLPDLRGLNAQPQDLEPAIAAE